MVSAVTAALVGGLLVAAGGAPATASPLATAATGTVTSPKFVSAAPSGQTIACTAADTRATKRWWMFGRNIQLDFGVSGAAAPTLSYTGGSAAEGSTVVTDTQGNLRFWSNGIDVWGADGQPIKNSGGGMGMSSAAQTVVAMPALGAPGKYFVVTTGYQAEWGTSKERLFYSVIDMNANGGRGEMTQKNIPLGALGVAGEGLSATPNASGDGFWVYSVAANTNQVYRWEFKANGPTSNAGIAQPMSDQFALYSSIHFDSSLGSNQGVILASNLNNYTMFTVDRKTGALTEGHRVHHVPVSGKGYLYGATFSPSGRYMIFSEIYGAPSRVYRVDTKAATAAQMRDSRMELGVLDPAYNSGGAVKLGPDGNIYANDRDWGTTLVKITDPDAARPGPVQRIDLSSVGAIAGWGLPDMVTGCEKPAPQLTATISAPTGLTLGDAVTPVTITLTNTGNTALTDVAPPSTALRTCPKTTLAPGEVMSCVAPASHWGRVSQLQNDVGFIRGLGYVVRATGPVGADPTTGAPQTAVISVTPVMDLAIVKTRTLTLNPMEGTLTGPATVRQINGRPWGPLPVASAPGKVFLGWYRGMNIGATPVTSTTVASLDMNGYAQYRPASFNVVFYPNPEMGTVTGATPSATFDSGCTTCTLPANGFTKSTGAPELITREGETAEVNSTFLGWSMDPASSTADIADRAVAGALTQTDGATVRLYAIWDDAPRFVIKSFPDRLFSLTQATTGAITEAELLRTVRATDRETKPLATKTAAQVASSGNDVGITLYDYDAGDFTSLTDTGVVSLTYKVKDEAGHVAFLRISVTVTDEAALDAQATQYLRGVSETYVGQSAVAGGFSAESLWLTDPTRQAALGKALSGSGAVTYCLDAGRSEERRVGKECPV